jgi:hypothetical protein
MSRQLDILAGAGSNAFSEAISAAILAIAAFATAWCAYQATLWSGTQVAETTYSDHSARAASETQVTGNQEFQYDATMFYAYLDARTSNRDRFATFIYERFRPMLKAAVDDWLAQPRDSGQDPLMLPEYKIDDWAKAAELRKQASDHMTAARHANGVADNYVFGTVLFAAVSLLGGAAPKFAARRLRQALTVLVVLTVVGSLAFVLSLPVGHREPTSRPSAFVIPSSAPTRIRTGESTIRPF